MCESVCLCVERGQWGKCVSVWTGGGSRVCVCVRACMCVCVCVDWR